MVAHPLGAESGGTSFGQNLRETVQAGPSTSERAAARRAKAEARFGLTLVTVGPTLVEW